MPSREPVPTDARSGLWVPAAAGVVLLLLIAGPVWRARDASPEATTAWAPDPASAQQVRVEQATRALAGLENAWRARDHDAFVDAAGDDPDAALWAARTHHALSVFGVQELSLDLGGERPSGDAVDVPGAASAFTVDVEVSWTLNDYRAAASTVELEFADSGRGVSVLGPADGPASVTAGSPLPVWLAGSVHAGPAGSRCVGVGTAPATVDCERLVDVAQRDLAAVLPPGLRQGRWQVIVPDTEALASALLGRGPDGLGRVAAVTTTLDASGSPGAPEVVVLNPRVFARLRPAAAQLVMTHEAAHAATSAASTGAPLWVVEGFADYVALRPGRVPVRRAAAELLDAVRRSGAPSRLPTDADFTGGPHGPGQTYEAAWLAFRLLGERFGDAPVLAFYAAVLDGTAVGQALEAETGLTVAALTRAWRKDLERLAG